MTALNDEELLKEFVAEGREHLSSIEPDLLILERDAENTDQEIINRIFRAIHSIKGASGFFGLQALKSLSHSMENTLMMVRDGKLIPRSEVMDPLLLGVDRLRLMFEDIQSSEEISYQDIVAALEKIMDPTAVTEIISVASVAVDDTDTDEAPAPPAATTTSGNADTLVALADTQAVEQAMRSGQHLYRMELDLDADFYGKKLTPLEFQSLMASTGVILSSQLDTSDISGLEACLESTLPWRILYASVLDADLIAATFDLSDSQFEEVSYATLFPEIQPKKAALPTNPPQAAASPAPVESAPVASATASAAAMPEAAPVAPKAEAPKKEIPTKPAGSTTGGESNETIRVKVDLLNKLMDLAGELVLARNQLNRTFESQNNPSAELSTIIQNVDFVTSDLQEHIMQTRMQAIASVFGKFPRLVRDLSRQLNKEITLEMQGEEVELDKSILESLSDPLTHLIRNCCDHAIERPEVREKNGKPRAGSISLTADQESGHINITVRDDGAGIDHERIARKALESGVVSEAALRAMSPQEQVNLIFMPGFSTAEAVTDVSGRGVGMDVVRTNIEQIGGSITISTKLGEGTTMSLRLPLTLAIIPSLVVRSCDQIYAVPQINLVELVSVKASQIASRIERVGSASVLRLRGKLLPLVKLSHVLGLDEEFVDPATGERFPEQRSKLYDARLPQNQTWDNNGEEIEPATPPVERRQDGQNDYNILVLKAGNKQYGLIVDEIRDIEEIVVKPLSSFLKNCKCFSGATIMGDGKVAMILDVAGIIALANLSFAEGDDAKQNKQKKLLADDGQASQSILLLSNGANEVFALPLSAILRLEKIQMSSIEKIGNQKYLPYQGRSMSLVFLHEHLPVTPLASDMEEGYLIIPKQGNATTGLIVSSILDTMEFAQPLEPTALNRPEISGSAVINNHITLFINLEALLHRSGVAVGV